MVKPLKFMAAVWIKSGPLEGRHAYVLCNLPGGFLSVLVGPVEVEVSRADVVTNKGDLFR